MRPNSSSHNNIRTQTPARNESVTLPTGPGWAPASNLIPAAWPHIRGYEILSVIGSGGMGIVYKARHRDLNRTVAIKMLRVSALEDPELRERFQAEAEAVAKLQHPNIIQVFEVGTVESTVGDWRFSPFISLEFVDGGSLESRTCTPQSPEFAARMVEKLARAAHAAHQVGVVHRDLKPANVLLTAAGEPKIADFGVAKQVANERTTTGKFVTQVGMAIGTPEYMAPEQVLCDTVTPAIDVYALGVMLYELLTARLPFQAPTPMETMELVINQDPVSPRLFQPNLPRDLETICLKCLQKLEERRYSSAEALADDLARWLGSKPIQARPIGQFARGVRWVKRNPSVAALWALVVLVAIAGLSGVTWKWREAEANGHSAKQAAEVADRRARAERWNGYRANIIAASSAFEVHNDSAARRALEGAPEEHRNWEWNYFHRRLDGSARTVRSVPGKFENFRFTPDRRYFAQFDEDSVAHFWDALERREYASFPWGGARGVEISPDGRTLAYSKADNTIVLHDVRRNQIRATMKGHTKAAVTINFSPDGTRLMSGSRDGTVRVWDTSNGEQLFAVGGHAEPIGKLDMNVDHSRFVTTGWQDRTAILWDGRTGNQIAALSGHDQDLVWVQFNPKGDRVLTVEHYPSCQLRIWNADTGRLVAVLKGHENQLTTHLFSPDGTRLLTASRDQTIRLWDVNDGRELVQLTGHKGWVNDACFSPDGTRIASVSNDHTVRIWNGQTGKPIAVLYGHPDEIVNVSYQGGEIVSHGQDGTVCYWDPKLIERDNRLLGHKNFVYGVVMHPDGKHVASASWDGTVRIWDYADGRELKSFSHGEKVLVTALAYHPKGRLLVSLCREKGAHLWDTETGELLHRWDVAPEVWRDPKIVFSPDGNLIATASSDRVVRVFDVNTKAEVATLKGHVDVVRDVVFSPDGRFLYSAGDGDDPNIRVWDLQTKENVRTLGGHTARVSALTFSADGKLLVSGSWDGTARVWDPATGEELAVLKNGANVYGLAFSPDGTRLGCACADNSIRLWDVSTKDQVAELRGHANYVHALTFSQDGASIISASGDHTLRVWKAK